MLSILLHWFQGLPAWLVVMVIAALPVTELRAAIPVGMTIYKMGVVEAMFYSLVGNLISLVGLLFCLPTLLNFVRKHLPFFAKKIDARIVSLEEKHKKHYQAYGLLFLASFIAVPLPGSGVWTGVLLAMIFRIKPMAAFFSGLIGIVLAGLMVLLLTKGVLILA